MLACSMVSSPSTKVTCHFCSTLTSTVLAKASTSVVRFHMAATNSSSVAPTRLLFIWMATVTVNAFGGNGGGGGDKIGGGGSGSGSASGVLVVLEVDEDVGGADGELVDLPRVDQG